MAKLPKGSPATTTAKKSRRSRRRRSSGNQQIQGVPGMKIIQAPISQGFRYARPPFRSGMGVDGIFRMSGTESSPLFTTSATANTEVINFINIDSRNSTIFPRLAQIGAAWSKFRVKKMHAQYKGEVGTTSNGSFVMALIYDAADQVVANWTMQRILATNQNQMTSIWGKSAVVKYDPNHASLRWYISGVTTGVAAQNEQTPVSIVYGFYSNLTSTPVGRVHVDYEIEFVEEISPSSNV